MNRQEQNLKNSARKRYLVYWLYWVSAGHIMGGIALTFRIPEGIWADYFQYLNQQLFKGSNQSAEIAIALESVASFLGPTLAAWGVLLAGLVRQLQKSTSREPRTWILLSTLVWYLLDCGLSIQYQLWLHVKLNSLALICIFIPVMMIGFIDKVEEDTVHESSESGPVRL